MTFERRSAGSAIAMLCAGSVSGTGKMPTPRLTAKLIVAGGIPESAITHAMKHLILLAAAAIFVIAAPASRGNTLTVAAASDLKFALEDCLRAFRKDNPDTEVKVSYGSSGNFCAQIANGAPFDLFLAADKKYPENLIAGGQAVADSLFSYAVGQLVVWVPKSSPIDVESLGIAALNDPAAKKVAIANPEHAPYGQAAVASMKSLGVYDAVKPRLVLGDNIAQTAQFVESGAADIGIIALSLAVAPVMADKGRYWEVPLAAFPRLEQAGVITTRAANPAAARALADFLKSESGKAVLKSFGFMMPEAD